LPWTGRKRGALRRVIGRRPAVWRRAVSRGISKFYWGGIRRLECKTMNQRGLSALAPTRDVRRQDVRRQDGEEARDRRQAASAMGMAPKDRLETAWGAGILVEGGKPSIMGQAGRALIMALTRSQTPWGAHITAHMARTRRGNR
jgi:hypothetical protein